MRLVKRSVAERKPRNPATLQLRSSLTPKYELLDLRLNNFILRLDSQPCTAPPHSPEARLRASGPLLPAHGHVLLVWELRLQIIADNDTDMLAYLIEHLGGPWEPAAEMFAAKACNDNPDMYLWMVKVLP